MNFIDLIAKCFESNELTETEHTTNKI